MLRTGLLISVLPLFSLLIIILRICHRQILNLLCQSTVLKYANLLAVQLKWAWDFLLQHSLFPSHSYLQHTPVICQLGLNLVKYKYVNPDASAMSGEDEGVACAICFCKIEEGEDVLELRCGNMFHNVCFDTCGHYNLASCPLCRRSLASPTLLTDDDDAEVLVFTFCCFCTSRDEDGTWWLR